MVRGDKTVVNTYTPIAAAPVAAALERRIADNARATSVLSCHANMATSVASAGSVGPLAQAREWNYGGLNTETVASVFFDPRSVTMRAPRSLAASMGFGAASGGAAELPVAGVPELRHGPAAYAACGDDERRRVKTQFAPHGPIPLPEPMVLYPAPLPCGCNLCIGAGAGGAPYPYSMAALLLMPANAMAVRNALEAAGVVVVSPELRALRRRQLRCASAVLGGGELFAGFATYASRYENTPLITTPNPGETAKQLNAAYVDEVLGGIRNQVIAAARANYLRAEGQLAYLQDLPKLEDDVVAPCAADMLPPVLPSGVRTSIYDTPFASYSLTNPRCTPQLQRAFACQTGLRVGANL
jgi:hypothetical protein